LETGEQGLVITEVVRAKHAADTEGVQNRTSGEAYQKNTFLRRPGSFHHDEAVLSVVA
jgi:hypothetical protein